MLGQDCKGNLLGISHPPLGNPGLKELSNSEAAAFLTLVGDEKQKHFPKHHLAGEETLARSVLPGTTP